MIHQHFFNVRLDLDLDGARNSVYEVHTESGSRQDQITGTGMASIP